MTLQGAKLKLTADPGTGETTGTFEMDAGEELDIELFIQTGKLLGNSGGVPISIYNALYESGDSEREGVSLDLGGGAFGCRIRFNNWTGSDKQWGNDSNAGLTQASATGQDPIQQLSVLLRYLAVGEYGSRGGATFEVGEWSSSGLYSAWNPVAFQEPSANITSQDPTLLSGEFTIFNTRGVDVAGSAEERTG